MTPDRAEDLCSAYLEGELGPSDMAELQAALESEPDLLLRSADLYEIHRLLGQLHQPHDSAAFARATIERMETDRESFVGSVKSRLRIERPTSPRPKLRSVIARAALLSAALLAFALLLYVAINANGKAQPPTLSAQPASPAKLSVATLVRSARVRWEPDISILEGQRLETGPLRLGSGNAVLLFDSGAIVAVKAPAHLHLVSRSILRVDQGHVTVRAEGDAAGFTVRTPAGDALDLGTEFSVQVQLSGATEVHVQQGEVAWLTDPDAPPARVLRAGEAARFDKVSEVKGHPVVFAAQTIDDYVRQFTASLPPVRPTATESFDYPPGSMALEKGNGGTGWRSSWRLRHGEELTRETDTNTDFLIRPEGLSLHPKTADSVTPHGGALELLPGHSFRVRELSSPIDLSRDAVYYVSFLARRIGTPAPGDKRFPHMRLTLRRSVDFWGPSVGVGYPGTNHPTLQLYSRDAYVAPLTLKSDTTMLWVLKIVARRNQPDQAYLKVFFPGEALPEFEPAPWSIATDGFPADGTLDLVVVTGSGPVPHFFDELRIGSTWDSVIRKD